MVTVPCSIQVSVPQGLCVPDVWLCNNEGLQLLLPTTDKAWEQLLYVGLSLLRLAGSNKIGWTPFPQTKAISEDQKVRFLASNSTDKATSIIPASPKRILFGKDFFGSVEKKIPRIARVTYEWIERPGSLQKSLELQVAEMNTPQSEPLPMPTQTSTENSALSEGVVEEFQKKRRTSAETTTRNSSAEIQVPVLGSKSIICLCLLNRAITALRVMLRARRLRKVISTRKIQSKRP